MKSCVSGLVKNRKEYTGWITGFLFLLIVMVSGQKACAAVTEGVPGQTYSGDYVVIVNAGTEGTQSSHTPASAAAYSNTVNYEKGSQRSFYTYSGAKIFTCIGISTHCYIWMENGLKESYDTEGKTQQIASDMAETYEQGAWAVLNELSNGQMAYRDGSGRLSIALEQISSASGVYMGKGNEPDITAIHINAPEASAYFSGKMHTTDGLLVHEGQHALFEQLTEYHAYEKYMGITEGLSVAAMEYAWGNSDSSNWLGYIAGNSAIRNGTSLLYQRYRDQSAQDYGLPYLFIRYLVNRQSGTYDPVAFFHAAYSVKASGSAGAYLAAVMGGNVSFGDLVTDFYTAIAANEATGIYGFCGDAVVQNALRNYPLYEGSDITSLSLEPTAGVILPLKEGETFTVPADQGSSMRYRIVDKTKESLAPTQGNGTATDPYQVTSVRDWNLMANHPRAAYELQVDIDLTANTATTISTFSGSLDGNGHTVRGLKQPICTVNKGSIQNLKTEAAAWGVGRNDYGLIAKQNEGMISNCTVSGSADLMLSGDSSYVGTAFGAVTGRNEVAGTVQNCTVTASIHLSAPAMVSRNGGVVGCNSGIVQSCYFKGSLSVEQKNGNALKIYTGGIAGEDNRDYGMGGSLKKCLNAGSITVAGGDAYTGQICGYVAANVNNVNGAISGCYGKSGSSVPLIGWYGSGSQTQPELTDSKLLTEEEWKDSSSFSGLDFGTDWKQGADGPELTDSSDITSIQAVNTPSTCLVGEQLYWWGSLRINGSGTVQITDSMIMDFDNSRTGTVPVRIRYKGKSVSYTIQVTEPTGITSLTTSGTLKKKAYAEGEVFDPSGLTLIVQSNGQYHYIKSGFIWNTAPLKPSDTFVTLSYYGMTVDVPVTVTGKAPSKLEINAEQNRSYAAGSTLDLSSVKVRITYNNGEVSDWITASEFDSMGIHLAKASAGSNTYTQVSSTGILHTSDSGSTYCLYVGDILPGKTGTVCCKLGTITVQSALNIEGRDIYFAEGKFSYGYLSVSGGSESYQTTVKSERLPQGVTRTRLPDSYSGAFGYEGTAQQQGSYTSIYLVKDTVTGQQKQVAITIHVQAANEVQMISFELKAQQNPGLTQDVKGQISDQEIILEVPEGTDVTALMPSIDYGAGAGADCNYWNGTRLDFTNPVTYILTAPDGVTRRSYQVSVKFVKKEEVTPGPEPVPNPGQDQGETETEAPTEKPTEKQTESPPALKPGTVLAGQHPATTPETEPLSANQGTSQKTTEKATENSQPETKKQTGKKPAKKAVVTLNAATLPMQVKQSSSALKIKKKGASDSVRKWTTSNKRIVTVNAKTGKLTAKKTGKATITVTMKSGAKASCVVKVQKGKVKTKKLSLAKKAVVLKKKAKYKISVSRQPLTASDKVTFKSTNKKTATVTSKGVVTAKKKGSAYITVQSGAKKVKLKVTVR